MNKHKHNTNKLHRSTLRTATTALMVTVLMFLLAGWTSAQAGDDLPELRGTISVMPAGGIGEWVVGGQTFVADAGTELDVEEGPLVVDGCAKVRYEDTGSVLYAHEIDSEPAGDCGAGGGDDGQPENLPEWRGTISVVPAGGIGEWVVGGRTFVADAGTELDVEEGPLVVDGCAKVRYEDTGSVLYAHEIDSEPAGDCGAGGGDDGQPENLPEWRGTISVMPAGGIGEWVVGGRTFVADAGTELDVEEGPLVVDGCAKVRYEDTGSVLYAHEIDSEPAGDCGAGGGDDDGEDDVKQYGPIDSMPSGGREGEWMIGGVAYVANSSTEFDTEHGPFSIGACVEVESETATPGIAKKIETEHQYRCSGTPTELPEAEIYGIATAIPANLVGTWTIAGMQFEADSTTDFDQDHGSFEIGGTVKVKFATDENDIHHALEIESKFGDGEDDDDVDDQRGEEGHAFGVVDGLPSQAAFIGQWTIGGVAYEVTASTDLETEDGPFTVGSRVRVEYHKNSAGLRIADEIETTGDDGEVDDPSHTKLYGFVEEMPSTGFMGVWKIAGVDFIVNESSLLAEENGLFGLGSFVEVEYSTSGAGRIVHEMKTHVPPSAGDDTRLGVITSVENAMAAASIEQTGASQWTIGGVTYVVTSATRLVDGTSDLTVGNTALVNSYTADDGRAIATSIRGVAVDSQIYLPIANR